MLSKKILDGKKLSEDLNQKLKEQIIEAHKKTGIKPKLATILVGDNPASQVYIRIKHKTCEIVQIEFTDEFIGSISPEKDVDGLNPKNAGNLFNYNEYLAPCTPKGIIALLENNGVQIQGKDVTIINRSNLVGKPLIFMLLKRNATVSVCHTKTKDIGKFIRNADILVVAIGRANFITADRVKEGVVIIDVGMNRVEGKLCGDVAFDDVLPKVAKITPVPGGVGPMTVHMLMQNTFNAYRNSLGI
jgi:methylenetetrahydrofolate dehydrogenase (NADP+)/methenyltetrahydrofolate cyclohydrolase